MSTETELRRLRVARVFVAGGPVAVSDAVVTALRRFVPTVTRVYGSDRYATSRAIISSAFAKVDVLTVASGSNFPDAVASSGAVAAAHGAVLLYPDGQTALDSATRDFVSSLHVSDLRVAGGTTVMPTALYSALKPLATLISRLEGGDRFATSVAVNAKQYPSSSSEAVLVSGMNFPDALYAGTYAGLRNFPMYLSQTTCIPESVVNDLKRLSVTSVTLIGGSAVLTSSVAELNSCSSTNGAVPPPPVQAFIDYHDANPDNLAGQDKLALSLFKSNVLVRFEGATNFITGTQAQAIIDADKAAQPAQPSLAPLSAPSSLFKVWIVKVNTLYGWMFGGHWEFDKSFAGQTTPDDYATMQFEINKCAKISRFVIHTRDYYGEETHLGGLKDANLGRNAPVYYVHDRTSGFINQAHSGTALVWLTADNCPLNHYEGRAAFVYHAVDGGSVASVSAGWGLFSVSILGQTVELQKSTQPFDFIY